MVTGDETRCFRYGPQTERQSAERKQVIIVEKCAFSEFRIEMTFVGFNDTKGISHKEFIPESDHTVTYKYYLNVCGTFVEENRSNAELECREAGNWFLTSVRPVFS